VDWSFRTFSKLRARVKQSHKMTVESVVVNPKLEDSLFAARRLNKRLGGFHPEYFSQSLETYYDRAEAAESLLEMYELLRVFLVLSVLISYPRSP